MPLPINALYAKLGARIKKCRKTRGWSQGEAAKRYRLTQAQVSRLENGHQGMRFEVLVRVCRALHVPPSWLLESIGL